MARLARRPHRKLHPSLLVQRITAVRKTQVQRSEAVAEARLQRSQHGRVRHRVHPAREREQEAVLRPHAMFPERQRQRRRGRVLGDAPHVRRREPRCIAAREPDTAIIEHAERQRPPAARSLPAAQQRGLVLPKGGRDVRLGLDGLDGPLRLARETPDQLGILCVGPGSDGLRRGRALDSDGRAPMARPSHARGRVA